MVDTGVLIEALEKGKLELLHRLLKCKIYVPFVVLYEYLYGYTYMGRDYLNEKSIIEEGFTVVYSTQEIIFEGYGAGREVN